MAKFSLIFFSLGIFISVTEIASQRRPWSRCGELSLENGKVRIKNRGRVAKFRCNRGFIRFDGDRFATCVRQRWNGRIPKCVRRGCSYLTPPQYGDLDYLSNQAVVRVTCDPGYTLQGQDIITCNSRVWNATVPACQASYTFPPMACTFERDTCGWTNSPDNHFFWELKSAALLHLFDQNNSPVTDHTLGTATGKFMIASAAISAAVGGSDGEGPRATLYSPVFQAAPGGVACFTFFYHIYGGRGTGELRVYFKPEDTSIEFLAPDFQTSSRSHASWVREKLVFTNVTQPFQIVFESEEQGVFYSDVAVDDVMVNYDRVCTATTTTATTAATTITTTANATTGDDATTTTTTTTEVPLTVIYETTTLDTTTTTTTTTSATATTTGVAATDFSFPSSSSSSFFHSTSPSSSSFNFNTTSTPYVPPSSSSSSSPSFFHTTTSTSSSSSSSSFSSSSFNFNSTSSPLFSSSSSSSSSSLSFFHTTASPFSSSSTSNFFPTSPSSSSSSSSSFFPPSSSLPPPPSPPPPPPLPPIPTTTTTTSTTNTIPTTTTTTPTITTTPTTTTTTTTPTTTTTTSPTPPPPHPTTTTTTTPHTNWPAATPPYTLTHTTTTPPTTSTSTTTVAVVVVVVAAAVVFVVVAVVRRRRRGEEVEVSDMECLASDEVQMMDTLTFTYGQGRGHRPTPV